MKIGSLLNRFFHFRIPRLSENQPISESDEFNGAVMQGDLVKVTTLLKENPNLVLNRDKYGSTPLHWAEESGHKDLVKLLLANGAEVNTGSKPLQNKSKLKFLRDITPLHLAAGSGQKEVVKLLLANGAFVNTKDGKGRTALLMAARRGQKDVAELLLANGAEVNTKDNQGGTPLHWAVKKDHRVLAELLRQHGGYR